MSQTAKLHPAIYDSRAGGYSAVQRAGAYRTVLGYWFVAALLVLYAGILTIQRDNSWDTDVWEHQRAVRVLAENFDHPGNPTYASPEPSIRYSPYTVIMALAVRWTGITSYGVLNLAAFINMGLFLFALWYLLRQLNAERYGLAALFALLLVYWKVPSYVGSMALPDLPGCEACPSAFSVALVLLVWAFVLRMRSSNAALWLMPLAIIFAATAVLSHAMVGVFMAICLLIALSFSPQYLWARMIGILAVLTLGTVLLCFAWPLYSFREAITTKVDDGWFYAASEIGHSLVNWTSLAFALALVAWPFIWRRRLARMCAVGWVLCFGLGLVSLHFKSALLARQPLLGILFPAIAIGIFISETGIFRVGTWPQRWRTLTGVMTGHRIRAAAEIFIFLVLLICIPRELFTVARRVAPVFQQPDPRLHLRPRLEALLTDVGPSDVVLADAQTSWPVPAFTGRIVVAAHLEFFVPNQNERNLDVNEFLKPACTQARRDALLEKYHVRWILLFATGTTETNAQGQGQNLAQMASLLEPGAVVKQDHNFVLIDARKWQSLRKTTARL